MKHVSCAYKGLWQPNASPRQTLISTTNSHVIVYRETYYYNEERLHYEYKIEIQVQLSKGHKIDGFAYYK